MVARQWNSNTYRLPCAIIQSLSTLGSLLSILRKHAAYRVLCHGKQAVHGMVRRVAIGDVLIHGDDGPGVQSQLPVDVEGAIFVPENAFDEVMVRGFVSVASWRTEVSF